MSKHLLSLLSVLRDKFTLRCEAAKNEIQAFTEPPFQKKTYRIDKNDDLRMIDQRANQVSVILKNVQYRNSKTNHLSFTNSINRKNI